jgi:hypothetical protein
LTSLGDQLKAGLSATAQMQDDEAGPSVSVLAGRIKTLKASHSIEATPHHVRLKHSAAEEPVTARVRRRTEANPASGQEIDTDGGIGGGNRMLAAALKDAPHRQPSSFRQRIETERERIEGPENIL